MTEPTDKQLEDFAVEEQFLLFCDVDEFTQIARAVLAKWGTAAPVGVEPYGQITTHSVTGQQFFYRWPESPYLDNASECVSVYTTPQPTQSVRESMTPEQISAAAKKLAECMGYPWEFMPEPGRANMRKHAQAVIESAHDTKAKEAGNAE